MAKIDLISNDWVDLVFQNKNQAYGAYKLRKGTSMRNIYAIIIVFIIAILALLFVAVKSVIDKNAAKVKVDQAVELSALTQKKAEVKDKIITPPKEVIKQVKTSIKFVAPVIKKDNEVKPEEELKTQAEVLDTKAAIGSFNVEGNSDTGEVLKATQAVVQPPPPPVDNTPLDIAEEMPTPPYNPQAYINEHINYPVVAAENGVQGRVVVGFTVNRDGSIVDVNILKSVDPSLDKEAMRVVRTMPNWTPGRQNGQTVRVKYNVPVNFRLQ